MSTYRFDRLLSPRSVALVGASARPNAFGAAILRNLREAGFAGPIWPVNPRHDSVDGVQAFADLADLHEPADLVVIVTPPETVPEVVEAADECQVVAGEGGRARSFLMSAFPQACRMAAD